MGHTCCHGSYFGSIVSSDAAPQRRSGERSKADVTEPHENTVRMRGLVNRAAGAIMTKTVETTSFLFSKQWDDFGGYQ